MAHHRKSRAKWLALIQEFEQSKETQTEFARRHRVRVSTFRKWLYQLRQEPAEEEVRFVELTTDIVQTAAAVEITVGRGVMLRMSPEIKPEHVVALVAGLVRAGC